MATKCCLVFPLLIVAVWLASATATSTDREPKQLLFPYSPLYRVQPVQSRYGPLSRQSNSPINPMIGEQGLGPFFGYFPNLLTQPCPACANCDVIPNTIAPCPNCTVCPEVIPPPAPPPPAGAINTCDKGAQISAMSGAPTGIVSLNVKTSGSTITCTYALVATSPNSKIKLTCTALSSYATFSVYTLVTPVTSAATNTPYISKGNFLSFSFNNAEANPALDLTADCVWENVTA